MFAKNIQNEAMQIRKRNRARRKVNLLTRIKKKGLKLKICCSKKKNSSSKKAEREDEGIAKVKRP